MTRPDATRKLSIIGPATFTARTRSAAIILLATLIVLRPGILLSPSTAEFASVIEAIYGQTLLPVKEKWKAWRGRRETIQAERRRRDMMTPLSTPMLEKKLTDLVSHVQQSCIVGSFLTFHVIMCFYRSFQNHLLQSLAIVEPLFITVDSFSRHLYVLPREQYLPQLDGSRTLLVPHRGRISRVRIEPVPQELYESHRKYFLKPASTTTATSTQSTSATTLQAGTRPKRLGANKDFVRQLRAILRIVLPRWLGKEGLLLALHTFFLIFRTVLSVAVAKLDGRIVRDLVSANGKGFIKGLGWWFALSVPSTYTNAMIRFLQNKLSLAFRTNLTHYVHDLYLNDRRNYYKLSIGLGAMVDSSSMAIDNNVQGPKEAIRFLTTDIARFCDSLASLYGNMGKPTLDLVIFTTQLAKSLGAWGTMGLFANYAFTVYILKKATPAFGKLKTIEASLEGEYRGALGRIGREAEEVAFYNGGSRERQLLSETYSMIVAHVNKIFKARLSYTMTEDFVIKYFWSAAGYGLMSIPLLFSKNAKATVTTNSASTMVASRTENYVSNRRLLLSLADAGGRLMYSGKEISELVGYTNRVYGLLGALHTLDTDSYPVVDRPAHLPNDKPFFVMSNVHGETCIAENRVALIEVPIVVPPTDTLSQLEGGDVLVKSLTFAVGENEHTLISGGNGIGKTSLARVIAGLWPVWQGKLEVPESSDIFYLSQRPYLPIGSLRDQVIYPHSYAQMKAAGRTEAELMSILDKVHLLYLPGREGGFDTRKEWKDVLSGGEKQRICFARMFYHRPKFAVLDDCTNAVSSDVEDRMYESAKQAGITLLTITHRPSLLRHHVRQLIITGKETIGTQPEYKVMSLAHPATEHERQTLDAEIEQLRRTLAIEVPEWRNRLDQVKADLSGKMLL